MKLFARSFTIAAIIAVLPLTAQAGDQKSRMKDCAKQYHEQNIAKSHYRSFMSQCLKKSGAKPGVAADTAKTATTTTGDQKDKMKLCNAEAKTKNLSGTARIEFVKACVSKSDTVD